MPLPLGENLGGGKVEDLTPRQLQVAELAAKGLSYQEIGKTLEPPMSFSTVRDRLHQVYEKLGINSKEQLGNVFADSVASELDVAGISLSELTQCELRTFETLASGITSNEAAKLMGVSNSTIRTSKLNIRKKLGFENSNELRSAATTYMASIQESRQNAAIVVQDAATRWLARIAGIATQRGVSVASDMEVPVNNGDDYKRLAKLGFVQRSQSKHPKVDLAGFIAVKAARSSTELKEAFLNLNTSGIAMTVLQNEVRVFLQSQATPKEAV